VRPGAGTLDAPDGRRSTSGGASAGAADGGGSGAGETGFQGLLEGDGVLVLLLLAAFGWGAVHALSPGHGKAMVAAYLVGTRGTARDAVLLGVTVTVTHTLGVLALGLVALTLSAWILPEDLYPWLNLVAGLLVLAVGAGVLRSARRRRAGPHRHHGHDGHDGRHHDHHHEHHHAHHHHEHPSHRRGLLAMGASAGLVPCPSALVVLLGAIAQQQIALGLVLIVAFSLGLAATLTALGLAVVSAGRALGRLPVPPRLVAGLPTASAVAIVLVGCLLTARALPALA
jgi:nickel/cobalt transporter (NicO) family protein